MYKDFFRIDEKPFSITPDPRYLYLTPGHEEALAHLLYGVNEGGGFVLLTGEVGTGKTSVCRCVLEQVDDKVHCALILNPRLNETDLVAAICDELGVDYPAGTDSLKVLIDRLNRHLLALHAKGEQAVVMLDEAQDLSPRVLEQVRLLTNLETEKQKLLQIILIGQPELNELLSRRDLRQVAQRITARTHLMPLQRAETRAYIQHRLGVAGLPQTLFSNGAINLIHQRAGGVPRLINLICDRAMLGAYSQERTAIDRATARRAAAEVFGRQGWLKPPASPLWRWSAAAGVLGLLALAGLGFTQGPELERWVAQWRAPPVAEPPDPQPSVLAEVTLPPPEPLASRAPTLEAQTNSLAALARRPSGPRGRPPENLSAPQALGTAALELGVAPLDEPIPSVPPASRPDLERDQQQHQILAGLTYEAEPAPSAAPSLSAAPAPPAAGPSLAELFAATTPAASRTMALRHLYGLWGESYDPADQAGLCDPGPGSGLSCLKGDDGWSGLETFDRPAMIELVAPDGALVAVSVLALDGDRVTLRLAGQSLSLPRAQVAILWDGSYRLLWRPPGVWERLLGAGSLGRDVVWLRRALAQATGQDLGAADSLLFDQPLREAVVAFQESHAIEPDGIVGPRTVILLNNSLGGDRAPRLGAGRS